MSEFDIKIKRVRSIINAEDSLEDHIRNVQSDVEHVSSNLGLRIARNEIFTRHGRQFKATMLNQWLYSKIWCLNIDTKYSPGDFDAIWSNPLSKAVLRTALGYASTGILE